MFTLYTTCRPFDAPFDIIQRNAICSWTKLIPKPQIILFGNDQGTRETAFEFGLEHITDIEYSPYGVPILPSMMKTAELLSKYDLMLLVAADTILFQSTVESAKVLTGHFDSFMAGVRRWDQDKLTSINFESENWTSDVTEGIVLGHDWAGDFFLYTRNFWDFDNMPKFVIGRAACDSWLFQTAKDKGCLVDVSKDVCTVHQTHGHNEDREADVETNIKLAGSHVSCIEWANWEVENNTVVPRNKGQVHFHA